jgi:hypothetical protein
MRDRTAPHRDRNRALYLPACSRRRRSHSETLRVSRLGHEALAARPVVCGDSLRKPKAGQAARRRLANERWQVNQSTVGWDKGAARSRSREQCAVDDREERAVKPRAPRV